jgi:hypothetical protein
MTWDNYLSGCNVFKYNKPAERVYPGDEYMRIAIQQSLRQSGCPQSGNTPDGVPICRVKFLGIKTQQSDFSFCHDSIRIESVNNARIQNHSHPQDVS